MPQRYYVARKDALRNEIVAVPGREHPMLQCTSVATLDWRWIWPDHGVASVLALGGKLSVQIRYGMRALGCTISESGGGLRIAFDEPESGVAPGQTAVLYLGARCLGSGTIARTTCLADLPQADGADCI